MVDDFDNFNLNRVFNLNSINILKFFEREVYELEKENRKKKLEH